MHSLSHAIFLHALLHAISPPSPVAFHLSSIHPLIDPSTCSIVRLFILLFTSSFVRLFIHMHMYSFIDALVHHSLCSYAFTHHAIGSFIHQIPVFPRVRYTNSSVALSHYCTLHFTLTKTCIIPKAGFLLLLVTATAMRISGGSFAAFWLVRHDM